MTTTHTDEQTPRKPIRLWPGVVAVTLLWLLRFGLLVVAPQALIVAMIAELVGGLAILVWWMFFSRAPWSDRVAAIVLIIVALFATSLIIHESIRNGMMGFMLFAYSIPVMALALVVGAVAGNRLSLGARRVVMAATILVGCAVFMVIRTGGITGDADSDFHWRWSKTPEQRLLAQADDSVPSSPAAVPISPEAVKTGAEWPGFRGAQRDGIIRGVKIKTDWLASPPVELWRRPIGPGWSSFAIHDGRLYTQEQRGDDEIVACYDVATGKPVWRHRDAARFWESNAGAGPRATPTLSNGRVYSLGATGIMNVLDAGTGNVVWTRNAVADTGAKVPGWGIAGSPLVIGEVVIVAASGSLVAYDLANGNPRWFGPRGSTSYSSPQLLTIDGVPQILLMSSTGATSVAQADGKVLWNHTWPSDTRIVQPGVFADANLLISAGDGMGGSGMRRVAVTHGSGGWTAEERWTSEDLNPNFNDFVIHNGYAYGFDYSTLACIDLADGKSKWKGGRYGHGQLVLLSDQDVLLVLSEKGELALVKATPDQFTELARFPAIEGKTWNHPVLVGDVLLVRNDHEMAAFRLALAGG
ncbi:MAG: PQQ-binding-like beta-propeller repeat protein [Acidobacteriota bacterium]